MTTDSPQGTRSDPDRPVGRGAGRRIDRSNQVRARKRPEDSTARRRTVEGAAQASTPDRGRWPTQPLPARRLLDGPAPMNRLHFKRYVEPAPFVYAPEPATPASALPLLTDVRPLLDSIPNHPVAQRVAAPPARREAAVSAPVVSAPVVAAPVVAAPVVAAVSAPVTPPEPVAQPLAALPAQRRRVLLMVAAAAAVVVAALVVTAAQFGGSSRTGSNSVDGQPAATSSVSVSPPSSTPPSVSTEAAVSTEAPGSTEAPVSPTVSPTPTLSATPTATAAPSPTVGTRPPVIPPGGTQDQLGGDDGTATVSTGKTTLTGWILLTTPGR